MQQNSAEWLMYLSGPMTGLSYEEAVGWRIYVAERMPSYIHCISPLRAKRYLKGTGVLQDSQRRVADGLHPLSTGRGFKTRDKFDVWRSHLLFINVLGAGRVSIGTVSEIAWADVYGKPSILVIEKKGNPHHDNMIIESVSFVVHSLDDGIDLTIAVLSTGEPPEAHQKSAIT